VEGFEVSGFVSRGVLVDAGEAPQSLVVAPQFVAGGAIPALVSRPKTEAQATSRVRTMFRKGHPSPQF